MRFTLISIALIVLATIGFTEAAPEPGRGRSSGGRAGRGAGLGK